MARQPDADLRCCGISRIVHRGEMPVFQFGRLRYVKREDRIRFVLDSQCHLRRIQEVRK